MILFGTDKIATHGYFPQYVKIAAELGPAARVCELGVESGESLWMWQALFPFGKITGVDVNPGAVWPPGTHRVVCAQDDPELPGKLHGPFGLIVDDSSHDGARTCASFDLLWPLIAPGGFYVIEDWMVSLRDAALPGETWGKRWNDGMLRAVASLLPLLHHKDAECESVLYCYGMAIVRKRK